MIAALLALSVGSSGIGSDSPYADVEQSDVASVITTSTATCPNGQAVVVDSRGVLGCPAVTDEAPNDLTVKPGNNYPSGSQTAADLILGGGIDEHSSTVADYSHGDCSGMEITLTIDDAACVLTEGTDWDAETSNAVTAQNIEAAAEAECDIASADDNGSGVNRYAAILTTTLLTVASDATNCVTVSNGQLGRVVIAADGDTIHTPKLILSRRYNHGLHSQQSGIAFTIDGTDGAFIAKTAFGGYASFHPTMIIAGSDAPITTPTFRPKQTASTSGISGGQSGNGGVYMVSNGTVGIGILAPSGTPSQMYLNYPQGDLPATCTKGFTQIDTGGSTLELCVCTATDTWYCTALSAGASD